MLEAAFRVFGSGAIEPREKAQHGQRGKSVRSLSHNIVSYQYDLLVDENSWVTLY